MATIWKGEALKIRRKTLSAIHARIPRGCVASWAKSRDYWSEFDAYAASMGITRNEARERAAAQAERIAASDAAAAYAQRVAA